MAKVLSKEEIHHFIKNGYHLAKGVFSRELAEKINSMVWEKLDEKPHDPSTWNKPLVWLREVFKNEIADQIHTKKYYNVIDDLCGEDKWHAHTGAGVWPILFPGFSKSWLVPEENWHIEGSWFHHHINSSEQGLVGIQLFTDIERGGGGTGVRLGSHHYTAQILAEAEPDGLDEHELCRRVIPLTKHLPVIEITGNAGDIIFIHPFTLHGSSTNTSNRVRIAANKCISLFEKLNIYRDNQDDYSIVELSIINSLNNKKLDIDLSSG